MKQIIYKIMLTLLLCAGFSMAFENRHIRLSCVSQAVAMTNAWDWYADNTNNALRADAGQFVGSCDEYYEVRLRYQGGYLYYYRCGCTLLAISNPKGNEALLPSYFEYLDKYGNWRWAMFNPNTTCAPYHVGSNNVSNTMDSGKGSSKDDNDNGNSSDIISTIGKEYSPCDGKYNRNADVHVYFRTLRGKGWEYTYSQTVYAFMLKKTSEERATVWYRDLCGSMRPAYIDYFDPLNNKALSSAPEPATIPVVMSYPPMYESDSKPKARDYLFHVPGINLIIYLIDLGEGKFNDDPCIQVGGKKAYWDNCGRCVGGKTGASPCVQDCAGTWGGTAYEDPNCGCIGGATRKQPCKQDCAGKYGGTKDWDYCGNCVENGIFGKDACSQDCAGEWGGTAYKDPKCGECIGGKTGKTTCTSDCAGVFNGKAVRDACGNCVGGTTGKQPCMRDCAGVGGGSAYWDECGNCVGGTTGLTPCQPQRDCAGEKNGTAYIDECGSCVGGNTYYGPCSDCTHEKCPVCGKFILGVQTRAFVIGAPYCPPCECPRDCADERNGTAYEDVCDRCVGGTTGLIPCDCENLKAIQNDAAFNDSVKSYLYKAINDPREDGYMKRTNGQTLKPETRAVGGAAFEFDPSSKFTEHTHTHPRGFLPSDDDLNKSLKRACNTKNIGNEHTYRFTIVSPSGALVIQMTNPEKFKAIKGDIKVEDYYRKGHGYFPFEAQCAELLNAVKKWEVERKTDLGLSFIFGNVRNVENGGEIDWKVYNPSSDGNLVGALLKTKKCD